MNLDDFRSFANLHENTKEDVLLYHLSRAEKVIKKKLKTDDEDYNTAIYCQTAIYVLPVLNLMTSEHIPQFDTETNQRRWLTPAEVQGAVDRYQKQLDDILNKRQADIQNWRYTLI